MATGLRLAFVGKKNANKSIAASYLYHKKNFKRMRLDDGISKFIRDMYKYNSGKQIKWEVKFRLYNAVYKVDNDIHIRYLLRKLRNTVRDVVVDDARYINEINQLREAGFIIIRIVPGGFKNNRLNSLLDAASGSIKLQEYFGQFEAYPTDYSITHENNEKLYVMLDRIVDKERSKLVSSEENDNLDV